MELRFDAEEWARMTPAQRARRCAILAEQAQKLADAADGKFKPRYLELAAQWLALGREVAAVEPLERKFERLAHGRD